MTSCQFRINNILQLTKVRYSLVLIFCAFIISGCSNFLEGNVDSQTYDLTLANHDFESWDFIPQKNDTIIITNHAKITHTIYITHPDGTVDNLGVQLPGQSISWVIPDNGDYLLKCWIHPVIEETLIVRPTSDDVLSK